MDRLHHLLVFVRVASCKSFSQAAMQLDMSRGAVSTAIQQLEGWLGTKLLHRTTRQVTLTQDGEALLGRAESLLCDMDELQQQFRHGMHSATGRVRVDMPTRIARRFVAPALPGFFEQFPGIELDLSASDRAIDLAQEGVDCVLRVGVLNTSNVVARSLGTFEQINCASPAYLARFGLPDGPAALDGHRCVSYVVQHTGRTIPWGWMQDGVPQTRVMASHVSANNVEIYIACALAGLGLIQLPRFDVQDHLDRGELVEVMPQARPAPLPVHLVYLSRHHLTRRVRAFAGWLEAELAVHLHRPDLGCATGDSA